MFCAPPPSFSSGNTSWRLPTTKHLNAIQIKVVSCLIDNKYWFKRPWRGCSPWTIHWGGAVTWLTTLDDWAEQSNAGQKEQSQNNFHWHFERVSCLVACCKTLLNRVLGRNPEVSIPPKHNYFHLRPYRDEPSASRPIRADKHRRGQRVLTWVTSREHCAAAGNFFFDFTATSQTWSPAGSPSGILWCFGGLRFNFCFLWDRLEQFRKEAASRNFCQTQLTQLTDKRAIRTVWKHTKEGSAPGRALSYHVLQGTEQTDPNPNQKSRPRMNTTQTGQMRAWQKELHSVRINIQQPDRKRVKNWKRIRGRSFQPDRIWVGSGCALCRGLTGWYECYLRSLSARGTVCLMLPQ